ncbi:MAG: hypothetical protein ACXABF_11340 [Candidatus Thorarchaeota archaeon]|jgi:hypothetical protein
MKGMEGYIQCQKHGVFFMPSGTMDCPACILEKVKIELMDKVAALEDEILFLNDELEEAKKPVKVGVDTDGDGKVDAEVELKKKK